MSSTMKPPRDWHFNTSKKHEKKIYFCLPAILTSVLQLSAQDIITKCNGEEIEAKVTEIGDTQIKIPEI